MAQTLDELLAQYGQDIDMLKRRQVGVPSADIDRGHTYSGVVQSSYSTFGQLQVQLDAGQRVSGLVNAVPWIQSPDLAPGASVQLVVNDFAGTPTYAIVAVKTSYLQRIPIALQNGWVLYGDTSSDINEVYGTPKWPMGAQQQVSTAASTYAGNVFATMSRYGVVRLEGLLLKLGSTPANGDIIAGPLPVNMRPPRERDFVVINNATTAPVLVTSDGYVRWAGGTSAAYFSVMNIRFRAAWASAAGGPAPFYPILTTASVTGFAEYTGTYPGGITSGAGSHTPGYTLDPDGVAIFEGALVATAAYSSGVTWGRLPTSGAGAFGNYPAACHQLIYFPGVSITSMRYGTNIAGGMTGVNALNFGVALSIGQYAILDNFALLDPTSTTSPTVPLTGFNSWTTYGAGWRVPCMGVTPDKQVFLGGLWGSGALGGIQTYLPTSLSPKYASIFANMASAAAGRLDVGGVYTAGGRRAGMIAQNVGGVSYISYDGVDFAAFDHTLA